MLNGLFINSSSVSGSPIRLNNSQYLRSRNFLNTSDVNILRVNSLDQIEFSSIPYVNSLGRVALLSDITDYSGQIAALQLAVGTLETDVNTLEGQVITLQGQMAVVQGDVSVLQSDVASLVLLQGTYLLLNGTRSMTGALNMGTHKISNVVDPTLNQDAATKFYVDSKIVDIGPLTLRVDALEGEVDVLQAEMITVQGDVASVQSEVDTLQINVNAAQIDIAALELLQGTYLLLNGTRSMTGALNMGTHKISNVVDPALAQDAATKAYVDSVVVDLGPLTARVVELESDVGTLQSEMITVQGEIITLQSNVTTLQIEMLAAQGDITYLYTNLGQDNTASNVGAGAGVFKQKTGVDLEFKSIVAGSNISVTPGTDSISIAYTGTSGEVNTASNIGAGEGVFSSKVLTDLEFKSLVAGTNITLVPSADSITINSLGSGDVTSGSNLGTGEGVYASKLGSVLEFKSLIAGANVTITSDTDSITINAAGSSSSVAISKDSVVISSSVSDINFTGANITVTDMGAGVVDVSVAASGGEVNTASNVGAGSGVFKQKTGVDLEFKSLIAGANVSITSGTDSITISSTGGGGGAGSIYYFNGGIVELGTIPPYYQLSRNVFIAPGADFIATTGATQMIAQFVTSTGDPNALNIPAGNWNFEMFFSASSNGGSPSFYVELYKYDISGVFTLISSNSAVPESITGGTAIDLYLSSLIVPATALDVTDRLAIRVYVNRSSRNITLHTQGVHVCQVTSTFVVPVISELNGLSSPVQYLAVGTSGIDFNIFSDINTHTFNIPSASASARGLLTSTDWSDFNSKEANTASNVGAGAGVFKQKAGVDLEFKTLIAGTNVTITPGADDVTISAVAGSSLFAKYTYTVTGPIIVDTDVTLPYSAIADSCNAYIVTGPMMTEGIDYTITGASFTLLAASDLVQALGVGDFVVVQYCR